jgi:hypothetical protein
MLTVTGQWRPAVTSYILQNIAYVNDSHVTISIVLLEYCYYAARPDSLLPAWLAGGGLWLLLILPMQRSTIRPARIVAAAAVMLCLVGLFCILVPRRPFLHYWQLLVVPWTLVLGSTTGLVMEALESQRATLRCGVLCATLLCTTGCLLFARAGCPHPYVGRLALYHASRQGPVAKELMKYARSGEALGTWGWMNNYYVETGLRQAVSSACTLAEILEGPNREYFCRRYLANLQRSAPPVFVDAVGPGNFYFQDRRLAHDAIFPQLAAYIRAEYTQVADVQGSRIYVRNDRLAITTH